MKLDTGSIVRPEAKNLHVFAIRVDPEEIDFMGHVNNAAYLKWVQAAVVDHWRTTASPEAYARFLWVAIRHEIIYRRPAFINDNLVAWVELQQVKRESAYYETIIRNGNATVAEVKSRWCCIEAETLKPTRLPEEVVEHFFPARSQAA